MKKFLLWSIILALCFSFVACGETERPETGPTEETTLPIPTEPTGETKPEKESEETSSSVSPLLYKVADSDGNTLWLFGSIHVGREEFYPLPEYVTAAYEGADVLAVEFDVIAFEKDITTVMELAPRMLYTDGTTIRDHIPQELYEKAVEILKEQDAYMSQMDYMLPVIWSNDMDAKTVQMLGCDSDLGIDMYFLKRAKKEKKEILSIESGKFQLEMLIGYSEPLQIKLLEDSVAMYEDQERAREDLNTLMDLWASGNEAAFSQYLTESDEMTPEEATLYEEYNYAMIVSRNQTMTDYAESALKSGEEVFICVGAAHIVGDGAMAQLLAQRGYTVERITD